MATYSTLKGSMYTRLQNLGPWKRYTLYIVPLALVLAVPLCIAFLRDEKGPDGTHAHTILGVDERRVWMLAESVWLGLWTCRAVAYVLPKIVRWFRSEPRPGQTQYDQLLEGLQKPVSLVFWMVFNLAVFAMLVDTSRAWKTTAHSILKALTVCSCIVLAKQFVIQMLRMSGDRRMASKKPNVTELINLYSASQHQQQLSSNSFAKQESLNSRDIEKGTQNLVPENHLSKDTVKNALKSMESTTALATDIYHNLFEKPNSLANDGLAVRPVYLANCGLSEETVERLDRDQTSAVCRSDRIRHMFISACAGDVLQAISELDTVLSIAVLILCVVMFVMFLSPSLLGAVATSATALLSLSFVFATTCQEVLGSCVFLFIKHPYDVGDYVVIDATELVVERISLLYTVFTRVQAAQSVQIPNIVLNSLWVDNVTKSGMFKEQTTIHVAFDTMPDSITLLKDEVQKALIPKGLVDITIGILSVVGMESLELQCISHFRMNRPDGALRAACRSCFMSTLVKALRETRIRGPEATAVATLQER